jgi:hypothetical protein
MACCTIEQDFIMARRMTGASALMVIIIIIIIIINPCKPYLTASASRLSHWGGGK